MAEFSSCHRNESSGCTVHGLDACPRLYQDDAHIFCTEEQVMDEVSSCIRMVYDMYSISALKRLWLKTVPQSEKRIGSDVQWDKAEADSGKVQLKEKQHRIRISARRRCLLRAEN